MLTHSVLSVSMRPSINNRLKAIVTISIVFVLQSIQAIANPIPDSLTVEKRKTLEAIQQSERLIEETLTWWKIGNIAKATQTSHRAVLSHPAHLKARFVRIMVLRAQAEFDANLPSLCDTIIDDSERIILSLSDQKKAFNESQKVFLKEALMGRGSCRLYAGRLKAALDDCDKAIDLGEQSGSAYLCIGSAKLNRKKLKEEAVKDLIKAEELFIKEGKAQQALLVRQLIDDNNKNKSTK